MSSQNGLAAGTSRLVVGILGIAAGVIMYFASNNWQFSAAIIGGAALLVIFDVINDLENPSNPVVPTNANPSVAKTLLIFKVTCSRPFAIGGFH